MSLVQLGATKLRAFRIRVSNGRPQSPPVQDTAEEAPRLIDGELHGILDGYSGKWVAISPPSVFLAEGDSPAEAYERGLIAGKPYGESQPAIMRVPTRGADDT